ncbi:hypothetical protein PM082_020969 [Marasmius tenuissimus]|nr:hypothetical protein PM082_020969 [Marasmius tenuissimus]
MPTSILSVSLASVALETLLFGIFLTLVFISVSLQALLLRDPSTSVSSKSRASLGLPLTALVRRPLFLASVGLMVAVSGHWICTIIRLFEASAFFETESALVSAYYLDVARDPYVVGTAFVILSDLLCDGTIIYRLFLIWGSGSYWIILFPSLCLAALAGSGIFAIYLLANASPGATHYEVVPLSCSIVQFFSTLLSHVYSTGMIAWRIWSAHRDSKHFSESHISISHTSLKTWLAIFVESGILYSAWCIFLGVTYSTRPDLFTLVVDNMAVIAGISFILINLRAVLQQLGGDVKNDLTCASVAIGPGQHERKGSIVYPTHLPVAHSPKPRDRDSSISSADWRVPGLQDGVIR